MGTVTPSAVHGAAMKLALGGEEDGMDDWIARLEEEWSQEAKRKDEDGQAQPCLQPWLPPCADPPPALSHGDGLQSGGARATETGRLGSGQTPRPAPPQRSARDAPHPVQAAAALAVEAKVAAMAWPVQADADGAAETESTPSTLPSLPGKGEAAGRRSSAAQIDEPHLEAKLEPSPRGKNQENDVVGASLPATASSTPPQRLPAPAEEPPVLSRPQTTEAAPRIDAGLPAQPLRLAGERIAERPPSQGRPLPVAVESPNMVPTPRGSAPATRSTQLRELISSHGGREPDAPPVVSVADKPAAGSASPLFAADSRPAMEAPAAGTASHAEPVLERKLSPRAEKTAEAPPAGDAREARRASHDAGSAMSSSAPAEGAAVGRQTQSEPMPQPKLAPDGLPAASEVLPQPAWEHPLAKADNRQALAIAPAPASAPPVSDWRPAAAPSSMPGPSPQPARRVAAAPRKPSEATPDVMAYGAAGNQVLPLRPREAEPEPLLPSAKRKSAPVKPAETEPAPAPPGLSYRFQRWGGEHAVTIQTQVGTAGLQLQLLPSDSLVQQRLSDQWQSGNPQQWSLGRDGGEKRQDPQPQAEQEEDD
ncbi:type III secretion system needle length determinant, SpaN/EivJ family [Chromobacterium vaccinii]|uniref:Type III secretion system needle length determinant, SpaN/EivJ family n=1 Tax=Chromobacterium vaccinii TaxID=1108595 RepID=A0ABV0F5Z3_9NEIS